MWQRAQSVLGTKHPKVLCRASFTLSLCLSALGPMSPWILSQVSPYQKVTQLF